MKRRLGYILPLVSLFFLVLFFPPSVKALNLISNFSFENGLTGWFYGDCPVPDTCTITADSNESFIGSNSLYLSSTNALNNFWVYQPVDVEPNINYIFSGHLKTDISYPGNSFFFVQAFLSDWRYVTHTFNSGSNTAIQIRTQLEFAKGTAWFDGLKLSTVNNPSVNLISNPSFEPDLSAWQFGYGAPGTYSIQQDSTDPKDGSFSLKLSSTENTNNFWGWQVISIEPNTDYEFSGWINQDTDEGRAFYYLVFQPPTEAGVYLGWNQVQTGYRYVGGPTGGVWRHYGAVINSGEANKFYIRTQLEWATGGVWSDGISLYKNVIPALLSLKPSPFILGDPTEYVSAFIEVPEEFSLSEIDISSVELNGIMADSTFSNIGDYNNNGIQDLELHFSRNLFEQTISQGNNNVTLDGQMLSLPFMGSTNLEVQIPSEAVQDLIYTVEDFNLQQGIDNSLDLKLDNAEQALTDVNESNDVAAINSLQAFINAIEAQRGNKITDEQADILVAAANDIIATLQ